MRYEKRSRKRKRERLGTGVVEVLVSVALMGLVLGIAVQMSSAMLRHRVSIANERSRSEAVNNLMEVCQSLPFERVGGEDIRRIAVEFSDGVWVIDVDEVEQDVNGQNIMAKRVSLQLKATSKLDRLRPALVVWRYPAREEGLAISESGDGA